MKKLTLTGLTLAGFAAGVLAQGSFYLDNSFLPDGLVVDTAGNWYSGTFGMEVWVLNGTTIPAGINLGGGPGSAVLGYDAMVAAGFYREASFADRTAFNDGSFRLGEVDMADVFPAGSTIVLALAAWNTRDASWSAMLANANPATRAGVLAFLQPTVDYYLVPPMTPPDLALNQDLILASVPEPGTFALAGLGGAAVLVLRRRK
jgi:hypothetical protein